MNFTSSVLRQDFPYIDRNQREPFFIEACESATKEYERIQIEDHEAGEVEKKIEQALYSGAMDTATIEALMREAQNVERKSERLQDLIGRLAPLYKQVIINDADARHFEKLSQAKVALSTAAASKARISNLETQLHVLQSQLLAQTKAGSEMRISKRRFERRRIFYSFKVPSRRRKRPSSSGMMKNPKSSKIWEDDLFRRICIVNDKLKKNVREEHYAVGDVGAGEDVSQRWQTFLDSMIELDLLDHLQHLSQMGVCSRYGLSRMSRRDMIKAGLSEKRSSA